MSTNAHLAHYYQEELPALLKASASLDPLPLSGKVGGGGEDFSCFPPAAGWVVLGT